MIVERVFDRATPPFDGCDLRQCPDGVEALEYLRGEGRFRDRAQHPLPHFVLVDQRMGRMDGLEVIEAMQADDTLRLIPTCLMSTSSQPKLLAECYDKGGTFFIPKPATLEELRETMEKTIVFFRDVLGLPERAARPQPGPVSTLR